jgi:large subunit ribosomal protein L25
MPEITLKAEVGRSTGSRATRRLRREGKIPAVVYGHGTDPLSIAVDGPALRVALTGESGTNQLLEIDTGSDRYLVLARSFQRHPVRGTVQHVDFQITSRDELVTVEVPVILVGDAVDVRHGDGTVDQQLFNIAIKARPGAIPTSLELDISAMNIGDVLRVDDLVLPDGVVADTDLESAIAIASAARTQVLEQTEEGADADAGEGAGTEAAPAPSADSGESSDS